jgi:hypothetical protein
VNVAPLRQQVTERKFGARIAVSTTSYAGNTQGVIFGGSALVGGNGSSAASYPTALASPTSSMTLEILHGAFVFLGGFARVERAEVSASTGLRILLA